MDNMAEIIHSTKLRLNGPWLIGSKKLLELDTIIENEWQKLLSVREDLITKKVRELSRKHDEPEQQLREKVLNDYNKKKNAPLPFF